ncbi:alpha/beta fold hydrolase [Pedobacter sp. AW31-3R]|uniref:alpha/beta fold hydrolase n=1 Tax=Pedobacter sp. AW31-3R TaxID=3445781 RepID=UPI003F9FBB7D
MTIAPLEKNNVTVEGNLNAKQTIVFAHGFGTDKTAWDKVKLAFLDDYRLVLYDNAGAGKAEPNAYSPIRYSTLNSYAEDLQAILTMLDLSDVIVVAHSVSSMIALLATIKMPERVSKLVFIGGSPRYLNEERDGYRGGFTQEALDGLYGAMTTNYYAWVSGFSALAMGNPDKPELSVEFARTLSDLRPDIALAVAKVIFQSDIRKEVDQLKKETLLLQAKDDIAVPEEVAHYLHRHIEHSTLKFLNASGHFPHISAPLEVITAIQSFI